MFNPNDPTPRGGTPRRKSLSKATAPDRTTRNSSVPNQDSNFPLLSDQVDSTNGAKKRGWRCRKWERRRRRVCQLLCALDRVVVEVEAEEEEVERYSDITRTRKPNHSIRSRKTIIANSLLRIVNAAKRGKPVGAPAPVVRAALAVEGAVRPGGVDVADEVRRLEEAVRASGTNSRARWISKKNARSRPRGRPRTRVVGEVAGGAGREVVEAEVVGGAARGVDGLGSANLRWRRTRTRAGAQRGSPILVRFIFMHHWAYAHLSVLLLPCHGKVGTKGLDCCAQSTPGAEQSSTLSHFELSACTIFTAVKGISSHSSSLDLKTEQNRAEPNRDEMIQSNQPCPPSAFLSFPFLSFEAVRAQTSCTCPNSSVLQFIHRASPIEIATRDSQRRESSIERHNVRQRTDGHDTRRVDLAVGLEVVRCGLRETGGECEQSDVSACHSGRYCSMRDKDGAGVSLTLDMVKERGVMLEGCKGSEGVAEFN